MIYPDKVFNSAITAASSQDQNTLFTGGQKASCTYSEIRGSARQG